MTEKDLTPARRQQRGPRRGSLPLPCPPPREPAPVPAQFLGIKDAPAGPACPCDGPRTFDAAARGETCGGLMTIGWDACDACGRFWLADRATHGGAWRLAGSGRSVETGSHRIRLEGSDSAAVPALAARLVALPALEGLAAGIASALTGSGDVYLSREAADRLRALLAACGGAS